MKQQKLVDAVDEVCSQLDVLSVLVSEHQDLQFIAGRDLSILLERLKEQLQAAE